MSLFKIKTAICKITLHDACQIVLNKINKNVYVVDGSELRVVCKLISSGIMKWESEIDETIHAK